MIFGKLVKYSRRIKENMEYKDWLMLHLGVINIKQTGNDPMNWTLLSMSVNRDHRFSLVMLLKSGADINESYTEPLIILATRKNRKYIIKILLKFGADVNVKDRLGNTALSWSKFRKNEDIINILKEHGAE